MDDEPLEIKRQHNALVQAAVKALRRDDRGPLGDEEGVRERGGCSGADLPKAVGLGYRA